jgi:hypothetical protein
MMRGWVWIGVLLGVCALAFGQQKVDVEKVQARYRQLVGAVSDARLAETVRWMAAQGSRVAGYPGADRAADYIEQQFRALGLQNVRREAFPITVPVDEEAHLHLNGQKLRVYPLWPNQVRTSQLPPDGVRGSLIYVRDGQLQQFRGKPVEGSIVLMDFNTGNNWLNAARLGARAIVFIEPETTTRGEAEAKFIGIPLDVPRFWLPRQHAAKLIALAETQPDLQAKLTCRMPWQVREGYNIVGVLPGSDPALKDQWIVVTAYYDSISIVPSLAPGADSAAGIASLLELARVFRQYPPKRSVLFVALSGHFQALEGVRQFIEARLPDWSRPNVFERLGGRPPAKQDIYLFVGLDLATRSTGVGVFYKSWFYDMREDIQRYFTDIGRVMREHAERIAPVLGTTPDKLFADGINAVQGRYWRTYIPGKPAFDAEAATLAGAWGITFATIEDSRPLVDTPFDTFENCNIANLAIQTRVIACQLDHVFNDPNQRGDFALRFPIEKPSEWLRIRLQGGFGRLYGNVYLFDPNRSFYPNTPVNGSIVVVRHWMKNLMGVRGNMFQIVDDSSPIPREQARFNFVGIPPITAYNYRREFEINAYKLNPDTGAIEYAPDLGIQGAENYPINILMTVGEKETPIIVFRCVATALYDLIDPQTLAPLTTLELFDGDTNARPRMFGLITTPKDVPLASYVEDVAVIFSQPGARLKIKMGAGPGADRMLLLNSTPDNPEGKGYLVGGDPREAQGFTVPTFDPKTLTERDLIARGGAIAYTALRVAEDMFTLNDYAHPHPRQAPHREPRRERPARAGERVAGEGAKSPARERLRRARCVRPHVVGLLRPRLPRCESDRQRCGQRRHLLPRAADAVRLLHGAAAVRRAQPQEPADLRLANLRRGVPAVPLHSPRLRHHGQPRDCVHRLHDGRAVGDCRRVHRGQVRRATQAHPKAGDWVAHGGCRADERRGGGVQSRRVQHAPTPLAHLPDQPVAGAGDLHRAVVHLHRECAALQRGARAGHAPLQRHHDAHGGLAAAARVGVSADER